MNTTVLVREACKVATDIANRPEMAEYKRVINRKVRALKQFPSARAAQNVLRDVLMLAEKAGIA